jgi:hypothetical protein
LRLIVLLSETVCGEQAIDYQFETSGMRADQALKRLSVFEKDQGRGSLDTKTSGEVEILIDVHLSEAELALIFRAEPVIDRG